MLVTLALAPISSIAGETMPGSRRPSKVAMLSPRTASPYYAVSEDDARQWLGRYTNAWKARDVAALSALGVIRRDQEPALLRALEGYKSLDVGVGNESISVDARRATVSFDRIDTDETGRKLSHPRQKVLLERTPAGVVATFRGYAEAK
jgi:hypothetical protein